jgi:hypothetical protein
MNKLLGDKVVRTTFYLILLTWGFAACSAVTGVWFSKRSGMHHLSPSEMKDVWYLPILLTIVWTPIILWRAAMILRRPVASPAAGAAAGHEATNTKDLGATAASSGVYIAASLLLFFGIALACNFAGDPQRWRVGVVILAVCTLPFVIIFLRRTWLRRALGRAELHLDARIQPGFSGTARYVRPLRGAELKSVEVRLSCEERVTQHFTSRLWLSKNRVLYEETIKPQVTPSADRIDIRIPLRMPPTASRSMSTDDTNVIWWLRLRLQMSGCPDTTSAFAIEVV